MTMSSKGMVFIHWNPFLIRALKLNIKKSKFYQMMRIRPRDLYWTLVIDECWGSKYFTRFLTYGVWCWRWEAGDWWIAGDINDSINYSIPVPKLWGFMLEMGGWWLMDCWGYIFYTVPKLWGLMLEMGGWWLMDCWGYITILYLNYGVWCWRWEARAWRQDQSTRNNNHKKSMYCTDKQQHSLNMVQQQQQLQVTFSLMVSRPLFFSFFSISESCCCSAVCALLRCSTRGLLLRVGLLTDIRAPLPSALLFSLTDWVEPKRREERRVGCGSGWVVGVITFPPDWPVIHI